MYVCHWDSRNGEMTAFIQCRANGIVMDTLTALTEFTMKHKWDLHAMISYSRVALIVMYDCIKILVNNNS